MRRAGLLLVGLVLLCTLASTAQGGRLRGLARRRRTTTTAEDDALALAAALATPPEAQEAAAAVTAPDTALPDAIIETAVIATTGDTSVETPVPEAALPEGATAASQGIVTLAKAARASPSPSPKPSPKPSPSPSPKPSPSPSPPPAPATCVSGTFEWPAGTGYCWYKRDSGGAQQGPGSNVFKATNVAVNSAGQLVLTINNPNNTISTSSCGEVFTSKSYGYGDYIFVVETNTSTIDTRLVGAPFIYANDTAEFDFEFSKWNQPSDINDSQFMVQPYNPNYPQRFKIGTTNTTHRMRWNSTAVVFESYWPDSAGGGLIASYTYTGPYNFVPGSERVHINYWIYSRVNAVPTSSTYVTNCFKFCSSSNLTTCSSKLGSKPRCSSTKAW